MFFARLKRSRRKAADTKTKITWQIGMDAVESFRATGRGRQRRMNAALKEGGRVGATAPISGLTCFWLAIMVKIWFKNIIINI